VLNDAMPVFLITKEFVSRSVQMVTMVMSYPEPVSYVNYHVSNVSGATNA
jgi:hypothetical protein